MAWAIVYWCVLLHLKMLKQIKTWSLHSLACTTPTPWKQLVNGDYFWSASESIVRWYVFRSDVRCYEIPLSKYRYMYLFYVIYILLLYVLFMSMCYHTECFLFFFHAYFMGFLSFKFCSRKLEKTWLLKLNRWNDFTPLK